MKRMLLGLVLFILWFGTANAQNLSAWSTWKNQRSSLLIVTKVDASTGAFEGTFINNATGFKCQGVAVAMSGKVTGSNITFVANFAPCSNTITVWSGKLSSTQITTDWELWYVDSNLSFQQLKGQDIFDQIK